MTEPLRTTFESGIHPPMRILEVGGGRVNVLTPAAGVRLTLPPTTASTYSDAQIWDYLGANRQLMFRWQPPLRMTVTAWASHSAAELRGTAGFGFWNQPFMPGQALPRLPRYAWFFFGSPPGNMRFVRSVAGHGWKAATLDMSRWQFLMLAPGAPLGFLLMRNPALYQRLWPLAEWAIGAAEYPLEVDLREHHTYTLEWRKDRIQYAVDGVPVYESPFAPQGKLGFVAWIDNQYAVVTPQGELGMGLLATTESQWLQIDSLDIVPLT
jgi:hypothetical protein